MYQPKSHESHLGLVPTAEQYAHSELSDSELILLAKEKNHEAFTCLAQRHVSSIRAHLYSLAPDSNDRSDFEQEVLIRIWRHIGKLKNPASFRAWIRQITTNIFYDSLRARSVNVFSLDEPIDEENKNSRDVADTSAMPDDVMQRTELVGEIDKALNAMPEQFRTALILRSIYGLSYDEIAGLTNSEQGTVKSRISRARDKVQSLMAPYLGECA